MRNKAHGDGVYHSCRLRKTRHGPDPSGKPGAASRDRRPPHLLGPRRVDRASRSARGQGERACPCASAPIHRSNPPGFAALRNRAPGSRHRDVPPHLGRGAARRGRRRSRHRPRDRRTRGERLLRAAVERVWLPALDELRPQMIFVSAGFDAHVEDDMAGLRFTEADYGWVTQRIKEVADKYAGGRIVSVLEGGYALSALGRSVVAHLKVLGGL